MVFKVIRQIRLSRETVDIEMRKDPRTDLGKSII